MGSRVGGGGVGGEGREGETVLIWSLITQTYGNVWVGVDGRRGRWRSIHESSAQNENKNLSIEKFKNQFFTKIKFFNSAT